MPNLSNIVQSIIQVTTTVAPLLGGPAPAVLAGLKALQSLLTTARGLTTISGADKAAIDAELTALQTRVTARAKALEDSLRGGGGGS